MHLDILQIIIRIILINSVHPDFDSQPASIHINRKTKCAEFKKIKQTGNI